MRAARIFGRTTDLQPMCTVMASVTIKNIPEPLYGQLKEAAARNRRSLNAEVILRLERSLGSAPVEAAPFLARARAVRERKALPYLTDEGLRQGREEGRV